MINSLAQSTIAMMDLIAAFFLMYGLKRMSSPVTASSGIYVAGAGMLAAVTASFFYIVDVRASAHVYLSLNIGLAVMALIIGGGTAWWRGKRVAMAAMPQMVALYNGMGGGAATAIALIELVGRQARSSVVLIMILFCALIGAISLSGSLIAWARLEGLLKQPLRFFGQQVFNALIMLATLLLGGYIAYLAQAGGAPQLLSQRELIYLFFIFTLLFGVLMTLPVGGADMPVVISIYNAFTGLAVALEGFVLQNLALMIAGMVVGSAGLLLTWLMAKAMNRSVMHVVFSNFGVVSKHKSGTLQGELRPVAASDAGIFMRYATSVIIVPGYGLALAHGQQKLYELLKLLQSSGVKVKFAVHPVAGRMPGQMDVLLAQANVPYDNIYKLEDINDEFSHTDVVLVIGANDVVNPAARTDNASPIFGMPILNVDQAKKIYVVKRGDGRGYAGIANPLFYRDNCNMVYGDAQAVLIRMIEALRRVAVA